MKPSVGRIVVSERDERRFWEKVGIPGEGGCMLWLRGLDANGYGQFRLGQRVVKSHQVSWQMAYGAPSPGLEPDHTCNIRSCVRPDHMDWVTHEENARRVAERSDACRRGHRWDEQDPIIHPNGRECRICRNATKRSHYHARKAAAV